MDTLNNIVAQMVADYGEPRSGHKLCPVVLNGYVYDGQISTSCKCDSYTLQLECPTDHEADLQTWNRLLVVQNPAETLARYMPALDMFAQKWLRVNNLSKCKIDVKHDELSMCIAHRKRVLALHFEESLPMMTVAQWR